MYFCFNTL